MESNEEFNENSSSEKKSERIPKKKREKKKNSDNAGEENNGGNKRGKRRSKKNDEGRDFVCATCGRTYLSYPALYTHMKTKHTNPSEALITSGRGRGRPKKNAMEEEKIDPTTPLYFQAEDKKGGPTTNTHGFEEEFHYLKLKGNFEEHPIYKHLEKIRSLATVAQNEEAPEANTDKPEEDKEPLMPPHPIEADNDGSVEEEQNGGGTDSEEEFDEEAMKKKLQKCCDEVFAEYLDSVARIVNRDYYPRVLEFVLAYRECLNVYGPDLPEKDNEKAELKLTETQLAERKEYTARYNPENAPDVTNEFIMKYIKDVKLKIDKEETIELSQNMCYWLYNNGYTCSKITLIRDHLK